VSDDIRQAFGAAAEDAAVYTGLERPDLLRSHHHADLIDHFEDACAGVSKRQIWVLPPGSGKTTTLELLVAHYLGRRPKDRVIYASYNLELATDSGRRIRDYVRGEVHQAVFPACQLAGDSSSVQRLFTTQRGMFIAAGVRGTVVGRRANLFVIDDPIKDREQALSDIERKKRQEWFKWVVETRLLPDAIVILCNTRWHEDDIAGWLLRGQGDKADGGQWEYVHFAAIAEEADDWRQAGDPLWPEAGYTKAWLEDKRTNIGTDVFGCVYQGRPSSIEGNIFKRKWITDGPDGRSRIMKDPMDWSGLNRYILVDPAGSKSKTSDYTAMWVVGAAEDENYYLIDCLRDKLGLVERTEKLFAFQKKYRPLAIGYEQYALQTDIAHIRLEAERINYRNMNIIPLGGTGKRTSKFGRIEPLQGLFLTGRIWFQRHYFYTDYMGIERDLLNDFLEDEYVQFPVGRHDDMLDALARIVDPMFPMIFPVSYDDTYVPTHKASSWLSA